MTFIVDGTSGLTFPNSTVQASAGQVLQVVQAAYSTQASTTSATYITSGLTASITPKFATSKILVATTGGDVGTTLPNGGVKLALYKNTTKLFDYANNVPYQGSGGSFYISASPCTTCLDSPATTSSVSYSVYYASQNGGTVTVQRDSTTSTIVLMEIAG
jgi:hypothetical protein